jgi:RNA polymerase sigma factor (sigma-70 family)
VDQRSLVERAQRGDHDAFSELARAAVERERAIVVLHYFLGMPLTEVAASLGIPVGTVKSRLHRALGEMRIAIAADADTPLAPQMTGGQLA